MLAIEKIREITPANLPSLTILTGDDLGQFELLKDEFLKQIQYDSADLNVTLFDMKEAAYQNVELDLVSLPFLQMKKIIILDQFVDLTTAKSAIYRMMISNPLSSIWKIQAAQLDW